MVRIKGWPVNRQQLLQRLDAAWTAFTDAYAGLPDARMTEPGVTGGWSIKDILAHITIWEEEALKHLPHVIAGDTPPRYSVTYGGIDAFNDLMVERRRALPLSDVLRQLDETHQRLIAYVETMPDDQITTDTRARRRLRLDTYSHYPIHTRAIREWREQSAT
ncbi:MAG: DinB family protein [Vicinamibacterales bacterium]